MHFYPFSGHYKINARSVKHSKYLLIACIVIWPPTGFFQAATHTVYIYFSNYLSSTHLIKFLLCSLDSLGLYIERWRILPERHTKKKKKKPLRVLDLNIFFVMASLLHFVTEPQSEEPSKWKWKQTFSMKYQRKMIYWPIQMF